MNVPDVKRQLVSTTPKPFATYLVLSIVFHAVLIAGMAASARWFNKPTYYKPASHIVSLVDAPSTLQQTPQAVRGKTANKKSVLGAKRPSPQRTRPTPQMKTAKRPRSPLKKNVKSTKITQTPNVKKPIRTTTSRPTRTAKPKAQSKGKQIASAIKPQSTRKSSTPTSKTKRQKKATPSPQSQTPTAKTKTDQAQQQAAKQRLTALRSRYGKYGESTTGTASIESIQHVRLRAYQELVREQIVDAWVLPLLQETARNLQATALLTVDREGHIMQLEILKTSNNPLFDESLLRAIRQVAPLPALPEDYRGTFLELELHFNPGDA
jgi:colicin import membrane protein